MKREIWPTDSHKLGVKSTIILDLLMTIIHRRQITPKLRMLSKTQDLFNIRGATLLTQFTAGLSLIKLLF